MWGCMGYESLAKHLFVKQKINSLVYQDVLSECLIPTITSYNEIYFERGL